ncbi:MAG: NUDIX hydrolase [Pseudomonadota bacterium]
MEAAKKRQVRSQFAALPFRMTDDGFQVMLVTSRTRKRWIIPKGWPEQNMTPAQSAEKEAFEEGGVRGKAYDLCLGVYSYAKLMDDGTLIPCLGMVYPLRVKTVVNKYPEQSQRRRKWFSPKKAASLVDERELKKIIKSFDPHWVVRRKS